MNSFEDMDLCGPLKRALAEQQYLTPTPIQSKTIPLAVAGRDILGCAQTGTGKTAAFALPILDFIGREHPQVKARQTTSLVLAPTRELAIQIGESFQSYGKHMRFRQALVYGGISQHKQVRSMRHGVDVLIATPGRLLDLLQQKHIGLQNVQILVLDEADRMLDMGFLPALRKIISALPANRQSLFFSATLPTKSVELSKRMLSKPVNVNVSPAPQTENRINERVRMLGRNNKLSSLRSLLNHDAVGRAIVFTQTKRGANRLARNLESLGIYTTAIHGNKTQNARQKALDNFRRNRKAVLVATDVASRGIDVEGITHVINYDMPTDPESYVHRIGRTGRAGANGIAISFCSPSERKELRAIEQLVGKRLTIEKPDQQISSVNERPARQKSRNSARPSRKKKGPNRRKRNTRELQSAS